jgi:hypothetical protein
LLTCLWNCPVDDAVRSDHVTANECVVGGICS